MLYGVFSDVHANYEALKAVLNFFSRNKVGAYICCGDLVGYGPQPLECVRQVMALKNLQIVLGNHDAALIGKIDLHWFNKQAVDTIDFARKILPGAELAWLATLPESVVSADFTLVHGSPRKPLTEYLLSGTQFLENREFWEISPCFIGHSHLPLLIKQEPGGVPENDMLPPLVRVHMSGGRYIFNPGSCGQPRDGNPKASCALYDSEKKSFEVFRLDYDMGIVQELMRANGFAAKLIDRLALGV